ncbi:MAG TPA: hypothetical protein DCL38_07630 [Lachnospiraceae bacterium]|nr:hypothetical protein [Lachnospiraceae bacterium]
MREVRIVMNNEGDSMTAEVDARIREVINEGILMVFQKKLVSFLRGASENYLQDYRNQILIWRQREDCGIVASKKALMQQGLSVPDNARPVSVLYPMVVCVDEGRLKTRADGTPVTEGGVFVYERAPVFKLKYQPVTAYALRDAVPGEGAIRDYEGSLRDLEYRGPDHRRDEDIDIYNTVRGNVSYVVETDWEESFSENGVVDYVNQRFLLKSGLTDRIRDRTMLLLYADYLVETRFRDEGFFRARLSEKGFRILSFMLKGAVLAGFRMLTEEFSLMPLTEAEGLENGEMESILMCLNLGLQTAMEGLSGRMLSFDETALCNSLLRADQKGRVRTELLSAEFPFRNEDRYMDQVMARLSDKLSMCNEGRLMELCDRVRSQSLTTFPAFRL